MLYHRQGYKKVVVRLPFIAESKV